MSDAGMDVVGVDIGSSRGSFMPQGFTPHRLDEQHYVCTGQLPEPRINHKELITQPLLLM